MKLLPLVAFVAVSSASVAAERAPVVLPKVGAWVLKYNDDSCDLVGQFGEGNNRIIMKMTKYGPGTAFDLTLYGKPLRANEAHTYTSIAFGPGLQLARIRAMSGKAGEEPMRIINSWWLNRGEGIAYPTDESGKPTSLPPIAPEQEAAFTYLDVAPFPGRTYRLNTGSMGDAMKAMRTCIDNLVTAWGFDPVQQAALSRRVKPLQNPGEWVRSGDYPTGLLMQGASGIINFRLDVDETGAATGCHIQAMTKPLGFADTTCRLIRQRAKFEPALDATGKPVKSYYVNTVRWLAGL